MTRASFLAAIALLAGCSEGIDNNRLRVDVIEDRPRVLSTTVLPLNEASAYLRAATAQGLVEFDVEGRIVPALASRWIVTDDGLSYLFRLKKMTWNDGREITSDEVARLLNTRMRELRGNRFGGEIDVIDRVISMTGKVVEIRLKAPMPYLLEMLAQPEFGLMRRGVGSGPMRAERSGNALQLRRREQNSRGEWTLDAATIALKGTEAPLALARFVASESDFVTGGRVQDVPLIAAANIDNDAVHYDAAPGLFGLLVTEGGPLLSDPAVREAIAMAIDRPRMLSSFGLGDIAWQEALTLVPATVPSRTEVARPEWALATLQARRVQAKATIDRWITGNGETPVLRIAMPRGTGSRILFARLRVDLAAIGITVERVTPERDADLRLVDEVADQSTPAWYLSQLSCDISPVCSADADALVAEARLATDSATRAELLGKAETELQAARNFIPLAYPLRWSVARRGLLGFAPNGRGWHLLQYLGREPT